MAIDPCRENPCLNGGTCISLKPSFRCECPDHYYGSKCESSTFGFDELSHHKAVSKSTSLSPFRLMIPPYTAFVEKLVRLTKKLV